MIGAIFDENETPLSERVDHVLTSDECLPTDPITRRMSSTYETVSEEVHYASVHGAHITR